jgi:CitMHS family citrate-Mg2+:H+ or citrate-Ca2+:H+ symporter
VQLVGLVFVFTMATGWDDARSDAWRRRPTRCAAPAVRGLSDAERALRRPRRFWLNVALTVVVMATMVAGFVDPAVMFMTGAALALVINYPDPAAQRARVDARRESRHSDGRGCPAAGALTGS